MPEMELTQPIDIAHEDGRLRREAIGWSRHPIQRCNFLPGVGRVHAWNYWCLMTRECALTVLVADVRVAGVALVSFLDFDARAPVERVYVRPFGLPLRMPDTPAGDIVLDARRLSLSLRCHPDHVRIEGDARIVLGERIRMDLTVERPRGHETVNVLVPWDETRYQFTSKQQALPVRGHVRVGAREYRFSEANEAFACLDFGRGRWPRGIEWCWGFASGTRGGRTIGLNLGGKWTDGTGVTENGVVIDGRVHKIAEAVDFQFDPRDFTRPWRLRSPRLELTFRPLRERPVRVPLGLVSVELHQCVGSFSGTFVDDGGATVAIEDLLGLAEWLRARW